MTPTQRRYSKEEIARRGDALVARKVRPNLTAADEDKFVAIDIETGEYELDRSEMKAAGRLRKRLPDSQIWLVHVTLGYLHRFGGQGLRGQP
jgi:IMP dehydrogenase/GMP reductase